MTNRLLSPTVHGAAKAARDFYVRSITMLKQLIVISISLFCFSAVASAESVSGDSAFHTSVFGVDVKNSSNIFPRVIFLDGMTFGDKQSWLAVDALSSLVGMPVGRFNIKFDPTPGMTVSDVVVEKTLRGINKSWEEANVKGLIVLFLAGNNQVIKALEVGKLYNHKLDNISFVAVANLVPTEQRIDWFNESLQTGEHPFLKYVNDIELKNMLMNWKSSNK